ncbi:protein phosphatase 2A B55 regulatory subunit [Gracilaria domingensis]|nr:protein phosphatase 2A B55 regulatory subunit [Gracilaria domingensis]
MPMDVAASSSDTDSLYDERLDRPLPSMRSPSSDDGRPPSPPSAARAGSHPLRFVFAQAFGERMNAVTPAAQMSSADTSTSSLSLDSAPIQQKLQPNEEQSIPPERIPAQLPQPQPKASVVSESDVISAVRFSNESDMLAAGDRAGRIIILKRMRRKRPPTPPRSPSPRRDTLQPAAPEYHFWTQFQSHHPEFDYLKSMEIEEKISQIRWCRPAATSHRLLATNDKTIKLWSLYEKDVTTLATLDHPTLCSRSSSPSFKSQSSSHSSSSTSSSSSSSSSSTSDSSFASNQSNSSSRRPRYRPGSTWTMRAMQANSMSAFVTDPSTLIMPRLQNQGRFITATPRRSFSSAHSYHINSISLNSDEETFLSADDLRVNLWNLERQGQGFNVLDLKPTNVEDLTEVVTCAVFHPGHCHLFVHSTSRGIVRLCDLRQSALCDKWSKTYMLPPETTRRNSFFSEIIASISDVKFSPDGRYFLTRDYMNLRLWDMNMERAPVLAIPVQEHLRARFCDLYENDCIFDKFQCSFSHDGGSLLTGSYNSLFQAFSAYDGVGTAVEASVEFVSGISARHRYTAEGLSVDRHRHSSAAELVDPNRRVMFLHASLTEPLAAVGVGPAVYMFYGMNANAG